MANDLDLEGRRSNVNNELKERIHGAMIYRVDPSFRELKQEHFERGIIPLGLFDRLTWDSFDGSSERTRIRKGDVLITFLDDILSGRELNAKERAKEWMKVSRKVVDNPRAMQDLYDGHWNDPLDEEVVQYALTLDAIFVTCFLGAAYYRATSLSTFQFSTTDHSTRDYLFATLPKTLRLLSKESDRSVLKIFQDMLKMENQIPLQVIGNVIGIICKDDQIQRNDILSAICWIFVRNYKLMFPCLQLSETREKSASTDGPSILQKQIHVVGTAAASTPHTETHPYTTQAGNQDTHPSAATNHMAATDQGHSSAAVDQTEIHILEDYNCYNDSFQMMDGVNINCDHLLHCVADKIWRNNTPSEKDIEIPRNNYLVRCISFIKNNYNKYRECFQRCTDLNRRYERLPKSDHKFPTAKELHKRGISFKGQEGIVPRFEPNVVWWWRATVYLPQLTIIEDRTEECWRNVLVFEDAYFSRTKDRDTKSFTRYLSWMNDLVNDEEDIAVLMEEKGRPVIIQNAMGDYTVVADLFNSVTQQHVSIDHEEWINTKAKIISFHRHALLEVFGRYATNRISEPWKVISLIGAFVLLVLTGIQTVFTVKSYNFSKMNAPGD